METSHCPHVIINAKLNGALECTHCHAIAIAKYPMSVTDWLAWTDDFTKRHCDCKPISLTEESTSE